MRIIHYSDDFDPIAIEKDEFVELCIEVKDFYKIISSISKFGRIILKVNNPAQLDELNDVFSELVIRKKYPFIKGVPFCAFSPKHMIELFANSSTYENQNKPNYCINCLLKNYCNYKEGFTIKPFLDESEVSDIISFLKRQK
ncbi:hypothetical protein BVX95_00520 [archaeon D22]|nr:hypothetical protein BVX95_00520 [archaeon D22]